MYSRSRTEWAGCALAIGVALLALGGASPDEETGALLVAIQARYDGIRTIDANFDQISRVASLGRDEVASGRVLVARPGRMRWEYDAPEPSVIVLDRETVRIFSPVDRKLQIAPLAPSTLSPTALGFLLGEADLNETFVAERLEPAEPTELRLKLVPRSDSGFQYLELVLERETYRLRGSVLVDLFSNRTGLRFRDVEENRALDEDAFDIRVPEGTDVIDLR